MKSSGRELRSKTQVENSGAKRPLLVGFKCFLHERIHPTLVSDFVIQKSVRFSVSYDNLTRIRLFVTAAMTTAPSITKTKYKIEVFLKRLYDIALPNNSKPDLSGIGFITDSLH